MTESPSWAKPTFDRPTVVHDVDTSTPHTARVWDYWLGGKDNFAADRAAGDRIRALVPDITVAARAQRAFLGRVARYLTADVGIRQFLDIGTGIPTADNTHEVAQAVAPQCRIVYVDNDPIVLAHARALLASSPEGATDFIDADARGPDKILKIAAQTLDFDQPVALILLGVLNHIPDDAEAHAVVNELVAALSPGSYLVVGHPTAEVYGEAMREAMRLWNQWGGEPITDRSQQELVRFFDGLELLEPGVVSFPRWRPDSDEPGSVAEVSKFGGVGRKP